jgi:hypothetical protein
MKIAAAKEMPRDPTGDAASWTFRTLEHDEMNSPHWIEATGPAAIKTAAR